MEIGAENSHHLCIVEFSSLVRKRLSKVFAGKTADSESNVSTYNVTPILKEAHQIFIVSKQKDFIGEENFLMHSFGIVFVDQAERSDCGMGGCGFVNDVTYSKI